MNTLTLDNSHSGGIYKLDGSDMQVQINIDAATVDNTFELSFLTRDTGTYPIVSNLSFVNLDGNISSVMTVGNMRGLAFTLRYNDKLKVLEIVENNLVSQHAATAGATNGGGGSSGGSGSGNRPEVLLTPDANGVITPDGSISNRFRFVMSRAVKIANPINFDSDEHIYLNGHQNIVGNWKLAYGTKYLLAGALPYVPPLNPKAQFTLELRPTENIDSGELNWAVLGYPDRTVVNGMGLVSELTTVGIKKYFTMGETFATPSTEEPIIVIRNGFSSEVTATITGVAGKTYRIYGAPVPLNGADQRPRLELGLTDFDTGGANRPSYGKAMFNFEGAGTFYVRDLVLSNTRAADGSSRAICPNGTTELHVNNVKLYNNNNGVMWGALRSSTIYITDCEFDYNGIGTNGKEDGYTHNVYAGHSAGCVALRSSFTRSQKGHDFKSRAAYTEVKQCHMLGAYEGREFEIPNGGKVLAENCIFDKGTSTSGQNDLVVIGQEGIEKTRPREYIFRNCRFVNHRLAGTSATFVTNFDTEVPVKLIDCEFVGVATRARADKGIIGGVEIYTGGPIGPLLPVGYQTIPMTPIEG
jgi:hypothetical protein